MKKLIRLGVLVIAIGAIAGGIVAVPKIKEITALNELAILSNNPEKQLSKLKDIASQYGEIVDIQHDGEDFRFQCISKIDGSDENITVVINPKTGAVNVEK